MRPADADDRPAVAELFRARSVWMRDRRMEGWQGWGASAEELAAQAGDPDSPVWVLTQDHRIVGVTTLYESPASLAGGPFRAENGGGCPLTSLLLGPCQAVSESGAGSCLDGPFSVALSTRIRFA